MNRKNIFIIAIILFAAVFSYWFVWKNMPAPASQATNFEECVRAGYPVLESYPRQCRTPDDKLFTESVAVSPSPEIIPGTKSLLYQNTEFGFDIRYPEGSNIKTQDFEGFLRVTSGGAGAVGIYLNNSLFLGTNLSEAAVAIGVSADPGVVAKCGIAGDPEEKSSGAVTVNGVVFNSFDAVGVGAGNIYESKIYRTVQRGSCYEIVEVLHSGNIGNYPPGTVAEFDKTKFSGILEKIARTFVFTVNAASGAMGTVTTGPTCPVERIPPDPACAPRSFETSITIVKDVFSTSVASDFAGRFKVDLKPGSYDFTAKGGAILPRCNPVSVEIKPQSFTWVAISCDTGIR